MFVQKKKRKKCSQETVMAFDLEIFGDAAVGSEYMEWLVEEQATNVQRHFEKLWNYYTNPMYEVGHREAGSLKIGETGRWYVQAQECGLPSRITGVRHFADDAAMGGRGVKDVARKEVVIENEIGWRINCGVDFLFGKPVDIVSKAAEGRKSAEIEMILKALFSANGGILFFQDMAVLGAVYGFVDCMVRPGPKIFEHHINRTSSTPLEEVLHYAAAIGLELIEAPRALPVLDENDYRKINCYVQHFYMKKNRMADKASFLSRIVGANGGADGRQVCAVTEIVTSKAWQRYEDGEITNECEHPWGFLPIVHIQNMAQPFYYEGASDVESLIPLQDELNTRLSDRASRITFQAFKMYLGKGIEGFENRPISPGRMWFTDNPDAGIEEFGGDEKSPSEDAHINEIREAMDKASSVTPLVAGLIKGKLGNLSSAVALRLTLMGMLSKTERKRFTYGAGIQNICRMALSMLDTAGIYKTTEKERDVEIIFQSPLPENTMEKFKRHRSRKSLVCLGRKFYVNWVMVQQEKVSNERVGTGW